MRKLISALALGALLIPSLGFTLGLGEIEVNSSLNQQLEANIGLLSAAPEDAETLIVKLASREEFIRAGLDRPVIVTTLNFKTMVEDGKVFVNVTTPKPVREPFLNFLIEVDWPKGHLIREYTILLDPPVFNGMRSSRQSASVSDRPAKSQVSSSVPVADQVSAQVADYGTAISTPVVSESSEPVPMQQATYSAPSYAPYDGRRIQTGDTAWSIAKSMRLDDSVSMAQMLIALLRANPEVFINENVNGLKRGYILRTPEYADVQAIDDAEAKAMVLEQNALWREYQQGMASDIPASSVDEAYAESDYSADVGMNDDSRLSIVSAGGGSSASGESKDPAEMTADELREQIALEREKVETERVEKETLTQQVGTLTEQVDKMKGLLTIEDDEMAEIQSAGMDDEAISVDDVVEEIAMDDVPEELVGEEEALDALDALTDEAELDQAEISETEISETVDEELFVEETSEQAVETESVAEQEIMEDFEPVAAPRQEVGLIESLLNNKMILFGLLVVVLVVVAIVYLIKRRRAGAANDSEAELFIPAVERNDLEDVADLIDDESVDDLVTDEQLEASMAEAEAEEEEFDAEATMILPSGTGTIVTPAANLQPEEEEEQDDVMAEADVYLAYGIYQQAEELLQNAIKDNPEKDNYRVKLAETYFAGKNAEAFAQLGAEMKERLGGEDTPAWQKVVAMGKELCPEAEVFQHAEAGEVDLDDMLPKSPEPMDFDLGGDSSGDAGELDLDFDTPLDEPEAATDDEFELPSMDETAIISHDEAPSESVDELEFDLSETDAIGEASADEEEFSLDIEASELDLDAGDPDMGLDLDMSMGDEATADTDEDEFDFSAEMEGDEESLEDLTAGLEAADEAVDFDMSVDEADLDLSMDDDFGDLDLSEQADEISTKLDLAKAYLDMGDHDGARDILEEVIASGNDDQKKEAEELMAQAG